MEKSKKRRRKPGRLRSPEPTLQRPKSHTNYENEVMASDTFKTKESLESVQEEPTVIGGFARRLTLGTLQGLGLSGEKNFDKEKNMQRVRALSISGQTRRKQRVGTIISHLEEVLHGSDEELSPPHSIGLRSSQVKEFNQAFAKDVMEFTPVSQPAADVKAMEDDQATFVDVGEMVAKGADIDEQALNSLTRPLTPTKAKTGGDKSEPEQLKHLYNFQAMDVQGSYLKVVEDEDDWKKVLKTSMPDVGIRERSSERRDTVYINYYTPKDISIAGLNVQRFISTEQMGKLTRWDSPDSCMVTENLHSTLLLKDGTGAIKGFKTKSSAKAMKENLNPTYLDVLPLDYKRTDDSVGEMQEPMFYRPAPPDTEIGFLYGTEAMKHYKRYMSIEKDVLADHLAEEKFQMKLKLQEKKTRIDEALSLAKAHYCTDQGVGSKLKSQLQALKENVTRRGSLTKGPPSQAAFQTDVGLRLQLESLNYYVPWFIAVVTVLQVAAVIVEIALGGVAPISFTEKLSVAKHDTWAGEKYITHMLPTNLWIGPSELTLVQLGALIGPCLRDDHVIALRIGMYESDLAVGLGCCEVAGAGAGTTTSAKCDQISTDNGLPKYSWSNVTCNNRNTKFTGKTFEPHRFKPCCYGYLGQCILATRTHCQHLEGTWYSDARESCAHLHCGRDICVTNHIHSLYDDPESHFAPFKNSTDKLGRHSHYQYWRLILSLFYHHGLVHVMLVGLVQCAWGLDVERVAGWLRIGIIYFVSGYGGLMFGSIAKPYEPNVGAEGAVFGLLGMNVVELVQSWRLIKSPQVPLVKLLFLIFTGLAIGFVPQMNMFAQVSGFILGVFTSVICLPYISFNRWHAKARLLIIVVFSLLTLALLTTAIFLFHAVQPDGVGSRNSYQCILHGKCNTQANFLDGL